MQMLWAFTFNVICGQLRVRENDCFRKSQDRVAFFTSVSVPAVSFYFCDANYLFLADTTDFSAPELYKEFKQYGLNAVISRRLGIRREVPDSRGKMYVSPLTKLQFQHIRNLVVQIPVLITSDNVKILMSNGVETTFPLGRACSRGFEVLSKSLEGFYSVTSEGFWPKH